MRPFWNGYLKLSLVTCPVSLTPATSDSEKVRFHVLNRATGNRVESRYVDADTGEAVTSDDQAKGYPAADGEYITLSDADLDAVALESTRTIDIDMFVDKNSIDWVWFDTPYYLTTEEKVAEEAFAVIREAMKKVGTVGIARLVLNGRERAVMLEPRGRGIVLWTLRFGNEVRPAPEIELPKADTSDLASTNKIIDRLIKPWSGRMVTDPVQDKLLEIIKSKQPDKAKKKTPAGKSSKAAPSIMDALRKSLEADTNQASTASTARRVRPGARPRRQSAPR